MAAAPGVLRGSGATFFYIATENIPLLAWRGRWARVRTLEHYLQEVAAQVMLSEVSATCRARIKSLDDVADDRVGTFVHVLSTLGLSHSALAVETLQQARGSQGLPRLFLVPLGKLHSMQAQMREMSVVSPECKSRRCCRSRLPPSPPEAEPLYMYFPL